MVGGPQGSDPFETIRPLKERQSLIDEEFLYENKIGSQKQAVRRKLGMTSATVVQSRVGVYERVKKQLLKAGIDIDTSLIIKRMLSVSLILLLIGTAFVGTWLILLGYHFLVICLFLVVWWVLGFLFFYSLVFLSFKAYLSSLVFRRRKQVEESFPEFLRLVATNYRSGLPLDRALLKSGRQRFGILSKEIELVVKNAQASGDLAGALEVFGRKFDSRMLERAMSSIAMSVRSGANISDLLEEIASNVIKMRTMRQSMAANVKNYIIFIVVAGVIIAPLMFSMSSVMNHNIGRIKGSIVPDGESTSSGMISVQPGGGITDHDFNVFAILMLISNSVISSLVISMIRHGDFVEGVKTIPLYLCISILLYFIGKVAIGSLLGGI
jgi:flagellar protein FlaJ